MACQGDERTQSPAGAGVLLRLTAVFVFAHIVFFALGVRFDRTTLTEVMHFMDPELLRHRLLETCFYMHIQPPVMNFLVGLVLKLPEAAGAVVFHTAFLSFGLTLYLGLFLLQVRLGVSRRIAVVLSTVFMLSPSFIVYEHWLFYTFPCAMLVTLATLSLSYALETRRSWAVAGFFVSLLLLCATRSMFHLYYFVLVSAAVIYACKGDRKRVIAIAMLPLLALLGLYAKNYALFGKLSVCTFMGKNLWITTVGNMGWPDRERLIEEGAISELSRVNRWSSLSAYPPEYQKEAGYEGIPVLRQTHKSTGAVNYNHLAQIRICNQYGKDALYVLTRRPGQFVNAEAVAAFRYFKSSTALPVSSANRRRLAFLIIAYDHLLYGKVPFDLAPYSRLIERADTPPYVFLLLGLPTVFIYGVYAAARGVSGRNTLWRSQRLVILFMCFTILYVAVLGCAFDVLETNRYRFMTDALSVALLGLLLQAVAQRRSAGGSGRGGADVP